jgi:hypothetical protein
MMRYRPILFIMLGVVGWSTLHAVGAWYSGHNLYRGLMIGGFSGAFLGFWAWLLYVNRQKWQRS